MGITIRLRMGGREQYQLTIFAVLVTVRVLIGCGWPASPGARTAAMYSVFVPAVVRGRDIVHLINIHCQHNGGNKGAVSKDHDV